jgi:diguanylate cyclase (GGDEF)-like protein
MGSWRWRTVVSRTARDAADIGRRDGWLIVGLVLATLVVFEGAVRRAFDIAHDVEVAHGLALVPALFLLLGLLLFHQYSKRQESKLAATAATAEAVQVRKRVQELERLADLGQSLAGCLTFEALQQAVWKHLPRLTGERDAWLLICSGSSWQVLADTAGDGDERASYLQAQAIEVLSKGADASGRFERAGQDGTLHFPMVVGGKTVGVLGIVDAGTPGEAECRLLSTAASLLAIAVRNVQLFIATRDNALHDDLTGCLGRGHTLEVLARELDRIARKPTPLSILMFDIDGFKPINDKYGHLVGDGVLSSIGQRVRKVLRASDTKCRFGGDEFLVILPETPAEGATHVAEWLRQEFSQLRVQVGEERTGWTVSVGTATTERWLDAKEFVAQADTALYQAKQAGRNCVRSFTPRPPSHERRLVTATAR